jgi:hypothetical protein
MSILDSECSALGWSIQLFPDRGMVLKCGRRSSTSFRLYLYSSKKSTPSEKMSVVG